MSLCEKCGTPLVETGAPIWEIYCPNKGCTRDKDLMREAIQHHRRREKQRKVDALALALASAAPELTEARCGDVARSILSVLDIRP